MSAKRQHAEHILQCFIVRNDGDAYSLELQVPGKQENQRLPYPGSVTPSLWPRQSFQTLTLVVELCKGLEEHFTGFLGASAPHCLNLVFEPLRVLISGRPVRYDVDPLGLRASAVSQEQHVVFHMFLAYVDLFLNGTGGMLARPAAADAVEALVGPLGWRNNSDVRACFVQWANRVQPGGTPANPGEAQEALPLRDPTHMGQRLAGDARFPYLCSAGRPKVFGKRFIQLPQLSCIPKSCGRDRGCRLGFLVLSDMLQAVCAIIEALDAQTKTQVKPLIGDLLLELDGKGPRVEGVPDAVRAAVAAAMASCARGWREAGERMDAWREAVQQSAVLAGLRGADDAPVLLTPLEALRRMQQAMHEAPALAVEPMTVPVAAAHLAAATASAPVAPEPASDSADCTSQRMPTEDFQAGPSTSGMPNPHHSPYQHPLVQQRDTELRLVVLPAALPAALRPVLDLVPCASSPELEAPPCKRRRLMERFEAALAAVERRGGEGAVLQVLESVEALAARAQQGESGRQACTPHNPKGGTAAARLPASLCAAH
ncbi:hypothetical protein HYH03_012251 [Edaphochlamys debaryana]|uniref:Uncharacterized protein n=1 Tax=Edaphochlamys debaryana TaxID=47281 RepID=A0A835Y164_9CHLO|nr:hypothetical protein HYH03_012251 [Edaphochlamys debaryana]|eukprot:KAG2489229.1 hypothetical protein HYH03_012251 [Edaphochlamys debaryana]